MEEVKKRIGQTILCELNVAPGKTALTVNCRRAEETSCRNSQKIRQFTTARHCV